MKQHFIPQSYLSAWHDPDTPKGHSPYVWRFPKNSTKGQRKAPKNIFWKLDMYTDYEDNGQENLRIENGFSRLETQFVKVRQKLAKRLAPSPNDRVMLMVFIASMMARTEAQGNHMDSQWKKIFGRAKKMKEKIMSVPPEERKKFHSIGPSSESTLTYKQVEELARKSQKILMPSMIQDQAEILSQMSVAVLGTCLKPGFITSDKPCVWFDPEMHERPFPFNSLGLIYPKIQITLPISPEQLVIISHDDKLYDYIQIENEEIIDDFNRRTRFHCHKYFIVNQNITKNIWFDSGKPQENGS